MSHKIFFDKKRMKGWVREKGFSKDLVFYSFNVRKEMSILSSKGKDASDSFMSILDTHYIIFMGKIKILTILLYLSSSLPWGKGDLISAITID